MNRVKKLPLGKRKLSKPMDKEDIAIYKTANIMRRDICDELKDSYLAYSVSVITSRAIPHLKDGLKPSQRRIIYVLKDAHINVKSARIVGDVLGKYHPHSNDAVYGAMVRLCQPFKMYVPYGIGQGNFGSLDASDSAASMRYCLTGDAVIKTKTHGDISYNELALMYGLSQPYSEVDIDIEVKSMNGEINKSTKLFHSGFHPTMELVLRNGLKIRGTKNHPVLTVVRGKSLQWKTLETLTLDDVVVTDSSHNQLIDNAIRVKSIKDTGCVEAVYSIRVDSECHSYVSNGIISHNTEAKVNPETLDIFFKNNQLGVVYEKNYDGTLDIAEHLVPLIPMSLVNGTVGTAVGFATDFPTHNPKEVIDTYIAYMNGKLTNKNIRKYLKGPDPVMPCYIIDDISIDRGYQTGRGSYYAMLPYEIEDEGRGRKRIVFTSVLPDKAKDAMIGELVIKCRDQKNPLSQMIADIRDESSKEGVRICVITKRDTDLNATIEALINARFCYAKFNISNVLIVNGVPKRLGIIDMLKEFHKMNTETSTRHLTTLRENKERRLHILDGIELVIENYDTVIDIIRKSKGKEEARVALQKKYKGLTDIQVNAILDTKLYTLINKGDSIKAERKVIKEEVKDINHNLKDIDGYILNLLDDLKKTLKPYAKRRCEIISKIPKTPV